MTCALNLFVTQLCSSPDCGRCLRETDYACFTDLCSWLQRCFIVVIVCTRGGLLKTLTGSNCCVQIEELSPSPTCTEPPSALHASPAGKLPAAEGGAPEEAAAAAQPGGAEGVLPLATAAEDMLRESEIQVCTLQCTMLVMALQAVAPCTDMHVWGRRLPPQVCPPQGSWPSLQHPPSQCNACSV